MKENNQILNKIKNYCIIQERCTEEIRSKLFSQGLDDREIEEIIESLIKENFINDQRFAIQYTGGKFRMKRWGRNKIIAGLQSRGISEEMITRALEEIDESDYLRTIMTQIENEKGKKGDQSIVNTLITKGFEEELVWEMLGNPNLK